ncbi:MAG: O-antigen ligase family protein [Candidatus Moraniibacteriota bacterium]|nr:MAG: O-antigen ligase family protein [Candidatus Moranbacteria bacterium]
MDTLFRCFRMWSADPRTVFGIVGLLIGGLGVMLMLVGAFPLGVINLVFFTLLLFLIALYRPNWGFLGLVAVLPFETVNLLPASVSVALRPYQWIFLIVALALAVRVGSRRTPWSLFRLTSLDVLLALIPLGAGVSGLMAGGAGVHNAVILASFFALYLLGRVFLRTPGDIGVAATVLAASGLVSLSFGIAQNIAFEHGQNLAAVMPGRPNGTFAEPDWLGLFAVIILLLLLAQLTPASRDRSDTLVDQLPSIVLLALPLTLVIVTLILTVSRSAWLAACVAIISWASALLIAKGKAAISLVLQSARVLVIVFGLALLIVVDIPLTRFDLLNRAGSTATGLQEITVACPIPTTLPTEIASVDDLRSFGCRHIDLEERATLAALGQSIQTIYRPDPNVVIRSSIYQRSWEEIRSQPVFGIGWGNIGTVLGRDEHGAAYNASNLWFEVWLGAGIIGLLGLAGAIGLVAVRGVRLLARDVRPEPGRIHLPITLSLLAAFLVFNFFNAGLLIGFVWIGFACLPVLLSDTVAERV